MACSNLVLFRSMALFTIVFVFLACVFGVGSKIDAIVRYILLTPYSLFEEFKTRFRCGRTRLSDHCSATVCLAD